MPQLAAQVVKSPPDRHLSFSPSRSGPVSYLGNARASGVRQVPRHPVCGGGVRPDSEDREPGRCRKARSAGANPVDLAEEPGELDGKGDPEVGVDVPGTVCDGHGL